MPSFPCLLDLLVCAGSPWFLAFASVVLIFLYKRALSKRTKFITDYASVAKDVRADTQDIEYDYIIVGGGTAGCVLASRLSEDSNAHVLMIEAGTSGSTLIDSHVPGFFKRLEHSKYDYGFYTTPQSHAGGHKKYWPRARLLGGCSSMNALTAQYGAPSDLDELARMTEDESWGQSSFSKYYRKFETYNPRPCFPYVNVADHGSAGPMEVGHSPYIWGFGKLFIEACINIGIPFSQDFNTSRGTMGVNKMMCYIDSSGVRSSTETAYLSRSVLARPNLKIVTGARVTQILFDSRSEKEPRASGVMFSAYDARGLGKFFRAGAKKEVIVCCGTVQTPQLLMLSGIGPASHLAQHNIPIVLDAPGVGANLADHVAVRLCFPEKMGVSLAYLQRRDLRSRMKRYRDLLEYLVWKSGPLASNLGEGAAFCRVDDPVLFPRSEYPRVIQDSTSGPGSPDLEFIIAPFVTHLFDRSLDSLDGYTVLVILLRPTSTGSIKLSSADPWDQLVIDPNYLATEHDMDVLLRGARLADRMAHTWPMTRLTDEAYPNANLDHKIAQLDDEVVREMLRARSETMFHPVGTCAMGPADSDVGVLTPRMTVKGVKNLRVCDGSIFPKAVAGHTAAIVIAAAEKLADMIKAEQAAVGK